MGTYLKEAFHLSGTARGVWRLLSDPPLTAEMNMAIDEAIALTFCKQKIPTVRLYQWDAPALTIGSFQEMAPLAPWLQDDQIPIIRRITGGRALLHDQEITYSVVADTDDPVFSGGIKKTFYAIAQGLLAGLNRLGIPAEIFIPKKEIVQSPFCIQSISWYEIAVSEKKLIGSAQKRWTNHFLQHGSIPLAPSPFAEKLKIKTPIHLCELFAQLPDHHEIKHAIRNGFETAFGIQFEEQPLTEEEKKIADRLITEKYGNKEWNNNRNKRSNPTLSSL